MIVSSPMNESELRNLLYTAQLETNESPFVIRYPRGEGVMPEWRTPFQEISIGKGRKLKDGEGHCDPQFRASGQFRYRGDPGIEDGGA